MLKELAVARIGYELYFSKGLAVDYELGAGKIVRIWLRCGKGCRASKSL